jgi:hypothetical protein
LEHITMRISEHKDARVFARYNIVTTSDLAEAMQKVSRHAAQRRAELAERAQLEEAEAKSKPPATIQ